MNLKPSIVLSVACLLTLTVCAQVQPFTVLSNNSSPDNKFLYVELMYRKPACGDYQAMFTLEDKSPNSLKVLKIDSVLNNAGTYTLSPDSVALMYPQAGGYRLRFELPGNGAARASDSVVVRVASFKLAYSCKGCGATGSDVIFEPKHVKEGCPYHGEDMIACGKRKGTAANWEAWIQDPRDCKPYRIAQMPDGSWWFAQNLNYQKDLEGKAAANLGGNGVGSFWCPGQQGSATSYGGNLESCKTYGALYTWRGMMSLDGRGVLENETGSMQPSTARGVCPEGWYVPGYYDWAQMLNSVEESNVDKTHLEATNGEKGKVAGKRLKATLSCAVPSFTPTPAQGLQAPCATGANPAWTYYLDQPKVVTSSHFADNAYGFDLIAAGRRTAANFDKTPGTDAYYWTSTQQDAANGMAREFSATYNGAAYGVADKDNMAYSVRCIAAAQ